MNSIFDDGGITTRAVQPLSHRVAGITAPAPTYSEMKARAEAAKPELKQRPRKPVGARQDYAKRTNREKAAQRQKRLDQIVDLLKTPMTSNEIFEHFDKSKHTILGDIALLRSQDRIVSTRPATNQPATHKAIGPAK